MAVPYPFSAIVAQDGMKQALLLAVVDPSLGGVMVFGDRGTGKSTAVRGLAAGEDFIVTASAASVHVFRDGSGTKIADAGQFET